AVRPQERRAAEPKRAFGVRLADRVRSLAMTNGSLTLQERPFVERDAEPIELVEDRLDAAFDVPCCVGVVDAEQERAAVLVALRAVRIGAQRVTEMKRARRARGEADPDHGAQASGGPARREKPRRMGTARRTAGPKPRQT